MGPLPPGENQILLVRLDGEKATHFSKIVDLQLTEGEQASIDVDLEKAIRIEGRLSENVPRPVVDGRIVVHTLSKSVGPNREVRWSTWRPVRPDGTFTIDGWPAHEALEVIALCDGYIAASGEAPEGFDTPPNSGTDPRLRPQVFPAGPREPIVLEMTPMGSCVVRAVTQAGEPVAGLRIESWPNVKWWTTGSQIYGTPLIRSEIVVRTGNYRTAADDAFPLPFVGQTAGNGEATLQLPKGRQRMTVASDAYELPAFLGSRDANVDIAPGETARVLLHVQPRGTDKLGEWDKLAGVVFGCSTREGRRICALPGVREEMDELLARFREAEDPRNPQLLSDAYSIIAEAFLDAGDHREALAWRLKAAQQASLADRAAVDREPE